MELDWSIHNAVRLTVERYYKKHSSTNNINIPMYDQFVTATRGYWEQAGYNMYDESDLFKMWGALQIVCSATANMLSECETREQMTGALKVMGPFGNMTGLFLREMTKNVPAIPAPVEPAPAGE